MTTTTVAKQKQDDLPCVSAGTMRIKTSMLITTEIKNRIGLAMANEEKKN